MAKNSKATKVTLSASARTYIRQKFAYPDFRIGRGMALSLLVAGAGLLVVTRILLPEAELEKTFLAIMLTAAFFYLVAWLSLLFAPYASSVYWMTERGVDLSGFNTRILTYRWVDMEWYKITQVQEKPPLYSVELKMRYSSRPIPLLLEDLDGDAGRLLREKVPTQKQS